MVLHTFNTRNAFNAYSHCVGPDDAIVLIEDAVYLSPDHSRTYHLRADVEARGVFAENPINYDTFVDLCVEADKVCSWF